MPDHTFRLTKCSHPALRQAMPNNEMTTIQHGERLAAWCASPGGPGTHTNGNGKGELLGKLRGLTESIHGWKKGMTASDWQVLKPKLDQWLIDEMLISDTQTAAELTAQELADVIEKVPAKLQPVTA